MHMVLHVGKPLVQAFKIVYKDIHIGHLRHVPTFEVNVMGKLDQSQL